MGEGRLSYHGCDSIWLHLPDRNWGCPRRSVCGSPLWLSKQRASMDPVVGAVLHLLEKELMCTLW